MKAIEKATTAPSKRTTKSRHGDARASDKARQLFGQLSAVRKQISELEKEVERLNERKSGLEGEMSKHEELRLYADEKLVIQTKIDGLENSLQTSLQTLIRTRIQRSRKRASFRDY